MDFTIFISHIHSNKFWANLKLGQSVQSVQIYNHKFLHHHQCHQCDHHGHHHHHMMIAFFIITMMMVTRFKASSWVRSECSPMRRERDSRREISWSASMGKRWSFMHHHHRFYIFGSKPWPILFWGKKYTVWRELWVKYYSNCLRWATRMRVAYICIVGDNSIQIFKMPIHSPHIWQTSLWWSLLMMVKGVWDGSRGCLSPHCQGWN